MPRPCCWELWQAEQRHRYSKARRYCWNHAAQFPDARLRQHVQKGWRRHRGHEPRAAALSRACCCRHGSCGFSQPLFFSTRPSSEPSFDQTSSVNRYFFFTCLVRMFSAKQLLRGRLASVGALFRWQGYPNRSSRRTHPRRAGPLACGYRSASIAAGKIVRCEK